MDHLMSLGLTRHEATIYSYLYEHQELTGYEAAKLTGISRSNVYNALASLAEKGAAYIIEGSPTKYLPVLIEELCDNRIRALQETKKTLVSNLPQITDDSDGYITIEGYRHIQDKIFNMLLSAKYRIYLAASVKNITALQLEEELKKSISRGIKVVILTDNPLTLPGSKLYFTESRAEQIRLITDSKHVLTGDIFDYPASSTCLYSGQVNFVNILKDALRYEIKLVELTGGIQ
jgi:HTH-type transcriptional regulator, sugar sensing transcriptional regulator